MKIGFVAGAFDLLHPGHIQLLRDCKDMCEYLVVGLHVDPSTERKEKNKPVQTVYERFEQLKACKYVDQVVPYETENDLLNMLNNGVINVMNCVRGLKNHDYYSNTITNKLVGRKY